MTCVACRAASPDAVCPACRRALRPGREQLVGGVYVRSAFAHEGPARWLVHRLKYEGVWGVAERLAAVMASLLPADAGVLVPVPRVEARRRLHGIDPGDALATALGARTGLPVMRALSAKPWVARRAGPAGRRRGTPVFSLRGAVGPGAVLVDDVVTSGTTLRAAAEASGADRALTATAGHSTLPRAERSS